jgi:hypothetical protein
MLNYIFGLIIFCIVLFIYLHVQFHFKTSDDLEIYELDNGSKDKLEEICDLRQPVILNYYNQAILQTINKTTIVGKYGVFEMKLRNILDPDYSSEIYIPLQAQTLFKLFDDDKSGSYISENNNEFLQETGLVKNFQSTDEFIRPGLVSNCIYDIFSGSKNAPTPFRYEINYRNFFYVTSGEVEIKLAPPKSEKYLHVVEDYDNFEFRSQVNPWKIQEEYQYDFEKIKCMDILLTPGKMICIPAYWFYSIRCKESSNIAVFKYRTYMNNVAILPKLGMHFLQMQNVKHNVVKKYEDVRYEDSTEKKAPDEQGVTDINNLAPLPESNELPPLNPATSPVEEIEIQKIL